MSLNAQIEDMFSREMASHGRAYTFYSQLDKVLQKDMTYNGFPAKLFFNPGRVQSVMADISEEALAKRPCFLCPSGLEDKQLTTLWTSPTQQQYCIRVNPFPIFKRHYTISSAIHERQAFVPHLHSMLALAEQWQEVTLFYNGPFCGASAPDHMHFQAVPRHALPIEKHFDTVYVPVYRIDEKDITTQIQHVTELLQKDTSPLQPDEWEHKWNVISWHDTEGFHTIVFFRTKGQPDCFFEKDPEKCIHISPATVEMGGIGIVAEQSSFDKLTPSLLHDIMQDLAKKID